MFFKKSEQDIRTEAEKQRAVDDFYKERNRIFFPEKYADRAGYMFHKGGDFGLTQTGKALTYAIARIEKLEKELAKLKKDLK